MRSFLLPGIAGDHETRDTAVQHHRKEATVTTTEHRPASAMRRVEQPRTSDGSDRTRRRRLQERHWLLIGAILFALEIVIAVAVMQAVL